jgi:predicted alpha/beta hydrolase family esterase
MLVAHSLACLLVAHWVARTRGRVAGAFLVSVPDPEGPSFPAAAHSFAAPPSTPLRFPALIVVSENDPYGSPAHAQQRAATWRAGMVTVGAFGHLNSSSSLGDWPEGRRLLAAFEASLGTMVR